MIRNLRHCLSLLTRRGRFSCGHIGHLKGKVDQEGHSFEWSISPWGTSKSVCSQCAIEASIECCFCSSKIYPGSPVALYADTSGKINWDKATKVGEHQVIGCLLMDCCPSGGFFAGYWTTQGFQSYFKKEKVA